MFTPGTLLNGTYKIIDRIGSGGGGEVYKAYHTHLDCYVAVKLIKDNIKGKLNDRTEADILKKIKHTYLPQVYDFVITDEGDIYTVMEFVEGSSFQELLSNGKTFTQSQVIKYAKQACEALGYLHSRKPAIVHSDIKPANIMLTPDDNICIIDFNISSVLSDGGAFAVGKSDGYSPPEQYIRKNISKAVNSTDSSLTTEFITDTQEETDTTTIIETNSEDTGIDTEVTENNVENEVRPVAKDSVASSGFASNVIVSHAVVDERSDVYALGATLYHLLSGKRPNKSIDGVVPIKKLDVNISYGMECIISKAMAEAPDKRYQNAGEMLKALENIHQMEKVYKSFVARNRMVYALLITATAGFFILAFSGYKRMGTERVIAYNEYAKTVEQMRIEGNTEGFDSAFEKAEALFTDRLDIHYQKALFMFERGEFDECISYISDILASHPEYNDDAEIGDLLFVNANCYFEKEDYKSAIPKYRSAIDKKSDNGEYYRDYAISLARTGDTDKASEVLDKAIDLGLSEENICLVNGEIFFLKESYEKAEKELLNCIKISEDDYIKQRAYILCSKVYRITERYEDNIALLEEAMKKLPEGRLYSVYELLATEYMDMGKISGEKDYYLKAVDIFTIMQNKGIGGYRISENKAIAYFTIGDYDLAKNELIKMRSDFGDNYRTEMYLAYVENGVQSQKDNNKRNYSDFVGYYKNAKALYEKQAKAGETDMEMLALDDAYEQLKNGNWL